MEVLRAVEIELACSTRAYGFDATLGLAALPVTSAGTDDSVGAARMLYLDVGDDLRLDRAGSLTANPQSVSCYDWYGNARPLFFQGRFFALMGYELIEGQATQGEDGRWVEELRRGAFSSILP